MLTRRHISPGTMLPDCNINRHERSATNVMRYAREVAPSSCYSQRIDQLVEQAGLDVLQIDYLRPNVVSDTDSVGQGFESIFLEQLIRLHKSMYLDPKLRIVANAGGFDTLGCVMAVADFLCEHGSAEMLVTSVRGDNVLAQLEEMMVSGLDLVDTQTGQSVREINSPPLAAQIELGSSAFAAALAEGSRMIIAGSYDHIAPAVGAAASLLDWPLDDYDRLACLATAVNARGLVVDAESSGNVLVGGFSDVSTREKYRLGLKAIARAEPTLTCADVHCDLQSIEANSSAEQHVRLSGIVGSPPTGDWTLCVSYAAGFYIEAIVQASDDVDQQQANEDFALLLAQADTETQVTHDVLSNATEPDRFFVRTACESPSRRVCEKFRQQIFDLSAGGSLRPYRLTGELPQVVQRIETLRCGVPRSEISVSVDTRPASDWI